MNEKLTKQMTQNMELSDSYNDFKDAFREYLERLPQWYTET